MPELPEVETFRRYVEGTSLKQVIRDVTVSDGRLLDGIAVPSFRKRLIQRVFQSSQRHGKYLVLETDKSDWLFMHFGMTGSVHYSRSEDPCPSHTRILFDFSNDFRLGFVDPRRFGRVGIVSDIATLIERKGLGPDALAIQRSEFMRRMDPLKGALKSVLMNQSVVAGIGNVYGDEILFQSRLHPLLSARQLDRSSLERLFEVMQSVLQTAIENQANPARFPSSFMLPHRNPEGRCPNCNRKWAQIKVSGRTTYVCPHCQRK